jgi:dTMP kinase
VGENTANTCTYFAEPGGTGIAHTIRELLKTNPLDATTELFLFQAARSHLVVNQVLPRLQIKNSVVVLDRYIHSTLFYQAGGRKLDTNFVVNTTREACHGVLPTITFLLHAPLSVLLERIRSRGQADLFEKNLPFMSAVHSKITEFIDSNKESAEQSNLVLLDATLPVSDLQNQVRTTFDSLVAARREIGLWS